MTTDVPALIQAAISRVPSIKAADAATAAANVQADLKAAGAQVVTDLPTARPGTDPSQIIVGDVVYPRDIPPAEWLANARQLLALVAFASSEPSATQVDALTDAIEAGGRRARTARDLARELARQGWTKSA